MPHRAVGIDLGTSRLAVARVDDAGKSVMLRDPQGDLLVPAVVYFEDDELIIGREAKLAAAAQPARAAEYAKRDLGQAAYSRAIGGQLVPAEVIEAILLRRAWADLATSGIAQPAAVLSVPAAFNQAQRRARMDACQIAGIELLGLLPDPLAAALALAETQGYLTAEAAGKPGLRVLVVDLGAGKLDAATIEIKPKGLRTMAVRGTTRLGGRDWDLRLAEYLAEQFTKQFGQDPRHDMTSVRRLLESAEEAKQALSARQQARVQVQRDDDAAAIIVTRQAFEEMTEDLLDQALKLVEGTLAASGIAWRDLGQILLVGGATRMPALGRQLEEQSGIRPATHTSADEAVARGAALYAECLLAARERRQPRQAVTITDMTAHSLGLEWNDPQTGKVENVALIGRGTELPCGIATKAVTDRDDQATITLQLLEGESRAVDECARIAQVTIRDLPPGLPKGTPIDVRYQYTAEGRLQIKAQLPKSAQPLPIHVRRNDSLGERELADWKQLVARPLGLKAVHAQIARHAQARPAAVASAPGLPVGTVSPGLPPALPVPNVQSVSPAMPADFSLETAGDTLAARRRKRGLTPRKLAILFGGYVVSALLGTVIGYYILMYLDPSWNRWHLRLPGIERPADR